MRLVIIGLDCLEPSLAFDRYANDMPTLSALRQVSTWGRLRSTDPPITVPAWSCMMTGQDPGQLGIYGFRNRKDHSYDALSFAMSGSVRQRRLWELLAEQGRPSVVLGVPQTFPPPRRKEISLVCGFLAPDTKGNFTCPPQLGKEIHELAQDGPYMLDVEQFRTDDKDRLLRDIYRMSKQRFRVARGLLTSKPWDFLMMVDMGPDRLHHGFWRYCSQSHRLFEPGNPYENVMRDYYHYLDGELAQLLALIDEDVGIMIVSDHGAQDMVGGLCINEWLIQRGLLTLKRSPDKPERFTPDIVDWQRTKAWGEGGYYGRLFINLQGREPQGQVPQSEYESFRNQLKQDLEAICGPDGHNIGTRALRPEDIYREVHNIAPDLMVYFGDLKWRSVGSIGMGSIYTFSNDTGPDDANHAVDGVFVMRDAKCQPGQVEGLSLYDIAPTVVDRLGLPPQPRMIGKVMR